VEQYSPQRARRARRKEDFIAKNAKGLRFKICKAAALPSPLAVRQRARSFGLHVYPNLRVLRDLRGDEVNVIVPDSPHGNLKNQKVQTMAAAEVELKSPFCPPFSKGEFSPWASHPSLEKHALSRVEGRGRGDFWVGLFRVSYEKLFTTEAQSSQSSENFFNQELFPPRPPRLRGAISESCSTEKPEDAWAEWGRELCSELLRQDTTTVVEHHG
jgi:hypothetical protein